MTEYMCSRCRGKFPFGQIRYDRSHHIVCKDCLGVQEADDKRKQQMTARDFEKLNYICVRCRYKFSITRGARQALKCPYCAGTQLMQVKKYKDENDLISESLDERFDE